MAYKRISGLNVSDEIYNVVANEIAPGTGISPEKFFESLSEIVAEFAPRNQELLNIRDKFQAQIDSYHKGNKDAGKAFDKHDYATFLTDIGYIVPEGKNFQVSTQNVDPEIANIAGPQLVVPVDNARFALNAANARWGSLYDAFYGASNLENIVDTDGGKEFTDGFNPQRGAAVIEKSNDELDKFVALDGASHNDVTAYSIEDIDGKKQLRATLQDGTIVGLTDPEKFVGFTQLGGTLTSIMLKNNDLHAEIQIDRESLIGKGNKSGVKDIVLESAITAIMDMEDSVAAVGAEDKAGVYSNFNGLMTGGLTEEINNKKTEKSYTRTLNPDKKFTSPEGKNTSLSGRSMMLVRNVGLAMYTDAVTTADGQKIPENLLDAMITGLAAQHDFGKIFGETRNSTTDSVYIVKPKMHSPDEVAMSVELFAKVEHALGLPEKSMKMGIMDEEQRMSVNLKEAVRAAQDRVIFINTGFLDRTGDLIHTNMEAGPMDTKAAMNSANWKHRYEDSNVQVGLATGAYKTGQIGKGMWAQNKNMAGLLASKHEHPQAGADTAWVPSPTGATIHALHYHTNSVKEIQAELLAQGNPVVDKSDIVDVPLLAQDLDAAEKSKLLDGYAQSILGYVVRWCDNGVGCSSVPDADDVYLMEDRATLRIGSQLLANWLKHDVITETQLEASFERMSAKVDAQNKDTPNYTNLVGNFEGPAYQTAKELVYNGENIASGYVEESLNKGREESRDNGPFRGNDKPNGEVEKDQAAISKDKGQSI